MAPHRAAARQAGTASTGRLPAKLMALRPALLLALLLAMPLGMLLAGCSSAQQSTGRQDTGQQDTGQQNTTGFVAGDGTITLLDPGQRSPAPSISGPLLGGGTFDLDALRGKVVVLNVWASWCAPCRAEAPVLEQVWSRVGGEGVQFVGLDTRDSEAAAEAFVQRFGITYPNVIDEAGLLQLQFRDTLPPQAIPSTVVIDAQGRVAARILGKVTEASLEAVISEVRGSTRR